MSPLNRASMPPIVHNRFLQYAIAYLIWLFLLFACTGGFHDIGKWLFSWERWDAELYTHIWEDGYRSDPRTLAFPPGFPFVIGALTKITSWPFNYAALVANLLFFFVGCIVATELLAEIVSAHRLSIFILSLTSPAAYFTLAPYSDALYFLVLWGTLFLAIKNFRSKRFILLECVLLVLGPCIRIVGFTLLSWLLVKRWRAVVIFIPLTVWLFFNYHVTGDALRLLY